MKNKIWKWAVAACLFVRLLCGQVWVYADESVCMDSPGLFIDICDFDSGSPVEGARLSVYRAAEQEGIFVRTGDAIEQWVSEGEPHKLAEGLIPGEMYFFMEEETAKGRSPALPLLFTVNQNGSICMIMNGAGRCSFFDTKEYGAVEAVFSCRTAEYVRYQLLEGERSILSWQGNGREKEILQETAREGTWITLCEQTRFSDGSFEHTGRMLFQAFYDKAGSMWLSERRPLKTVFYIRDKTGDVTWCGEREAGQMEDGGMENVCASLNSGNQYCFEETVYFDDGSSFIVSRSGIGINGSGQVNSLYLTSRKTAVSVTDRNMEGTMGKEEARLFLIDQEGKILESWEPGENPYEIKGRLLAGEQYQITDSARQEESLPDTGPGFRVLGDGVVTQIMFKKPEETEEDTEQGHKTGRMTVHYDQKHRTGELYLSGNAERVPDNMNTEEMAEAVEREAVGSWESADKAKVSLEKDEMRECDLIYTSPVFTKDGESCLPSEEVERNGKRYRRFFLNVEEEETAGETLIVSASTSYTLEGEESLPETAMVLIQDPISGENIEKELPQLEAVETGRTWIKNFSFPVTVNGYDAEYFTLGDMRLPSYSRLSNYGQEFLRFLGLPVGSYRIKEIVWDGEPYLEDGILKRDATARGERLVRNVTVTYGGEMQMPDRTGKRYVAGYEELSNEEEETTGEEESQMSAEETGQEEEEGEGGEIRPGADETTEQTTSSDSTTKMPLYEKAVYQIKQAFYWVKRHFTVVHFGKLFFLVIALTAALLLFVRREEKRQKENVQKQRKKSAGTRH
ncbi:hypothetical protein D5274_14125 [bacterium 1XD42-94]|nr:hypothetical protein [bacterium 1XD42-76]NBK06250.1 hypothetical protein [bacterium 1XD42-94]